MRFLNGILDRIVLVAGVIAGGTIPSFVAQYRQRVGGALEQVLRDLAPFQEIANQRYDGSLQALVEHHLHSTDATFHSEGAAITAMIESAQRLREAAQALNTDLLHQLVYLLKGADAQMLSATWGIFKPSFGLSLESLIVAGIVGVAIWLLLLGLWFALAACLRWVMGHRANKAIVEKCR